MSTSCQRLKAPVKKNSPVASMRMEGGRSAEGQAATTGARGTLGRLEKQLQENEPR